MKRIIISSIVLLAVALGTNALATGFTPGNLVIFRLGGNSSGATSGVLTNAGTVVWLDEYTTAGAFVRSHMMPTNYFGGNSPLLGNGTAFGNGLIAPSADGRFVIVPGYGATLGQFSSSLGTSFGTDAPRVTAVVDGNGNIDTTTVLTNSLVNGEEIRSATSTDGTNLWVGGASAGVRYLLRGATDGPQLSTFVTNIRQVNTYSNQLYFSTGSGTPGVYILTNNVANTVPTTSSNVFITLLAGVTNLPSPWAFALFNLSGSTNPVDTVYVADATDSAVLKYSLTLGTTNWHNSGSVVIGGAVGLAAKTRIVGSTTNVDLFTTGGGGTLSGVDSLWSTTDSGGYNAAFLQTGNNPFIPLASSASSVSFRGITFAPVGGETFPSGPGSISVGSVLGIFATGLTGCSVSATQTYSVANLGTSTVNWQATCDQSYVSFSPSSGTLPSTGSVTVQAFFNGNETGLSTGTNTATITFTNTTSAIGTTTRLVRLIESPQSITPSTDYITGSAASGSGYTLSNKTYTVKNGSSAITLTVSKTATWLDLSATSVAMGGCSSSNITVSLNTANANALSNGFYSDVVSFSNATAGTLIDTRNVTLSKGFVFWQDDFSTFIQNADLNGQSGWLQLGTTTANPLQVVNGAVVFPGGQVAAGQTVIKNFPLITNPVVYIAMRMAVDSAVTNGISNVNAGPSYIGTVYTGNNGTTTANTFPNYRFTATCPDTGTSGLNGGGTNFFLGIRANGQAGAPWEFGTQSFPTGTVLNVILVTDINASNATVYVNPTNTTFGIDPVYVGSAGGTNGQAYTADPGYGSFGWSQFGSAATPSDGARFFKTAATTNWAAAVSFLAGGAGPTDPFTSWQTHYFPGGGPSAAPGADPFGKGMSNTNQFLAGFNPTNTAAYLHIISISKTNGGTDIRVDYLGASGDNTYTPGFASRTNVLEFSTGVSGGNYSTNGFTSTGQTNILSGGNGNGTLANMVDPGGATNTPSRYYRVRVLVP